MATNQLEGPTANGTAELLRHLLVPLSAHDYSLCRHLTSEDLIRKAPNISMMQDENKLPMQQDPALRHTGSNAISIEEWEADTAAALAQMQARQAASKSKQHSSIPSQQQHAQPIPVSLGATGQPTDTAYVVKVNDLCQVLALEYPVYDIRPTHVEQRFSATASVAGQTFRDDSVTFPSKKDAKAYIAKQMFEYLENSGITKPPPAPKSVAEENYIGLLYEYANATATAQTEYEYFQLGTKFSCEGTNASYPGETFGSRNEAFPSKKAAKTNAAKKAVEYLRAQGRLGASAPTKKEVKAASKVNNEPVPIPSSPGQDVAMSNTPDRPTTPNYGERIQKLASELGIDGNMFYEFSQTDAQNSPAFFNCSASFPQDRKLPSPIHEVRNVYGKKNAKEECSKVVLEFLEDLRAQRVKRKNDMLKSMGL